jgi:hypothetical protein
VADAALAGNRPSFYGGNMDDYLRDSIAREKDVEGLCHTYRYNLYHDIRFLDAARTLPCVLPCTPLAVVKVLEALGVYAPGVTLVGERLKGRTVAIVNRSEIVGRPLAAMLANDGKALRHILHAPLLLSCVCAVRVPVCVCVYAPVCAPVHSSLSLCLSMHTD